MSDPTWQAVPGLPSDFHAGATLGLARDHAVLVGYRQGGTSWDIHDRRACVCLYTGDAVVQVHDGPGWLQTAAHAGSVVFAASATLKPGDAGSAYGLLRSRDGGRSWEERGPIPVTSLVRILAVSESEAWVLGAGVLARTGDGGGHWEDVVAPGERDPYRERLAFVTDRVLLLGAGIHTTGDGGKSWKSYLTEGAAVHAAVGKLILATEAGALRLGAVTAQGTDWLVRFPEAVKPYRMLVEGDVVRFLALPADPTARRGGHLLYTSPDLGSSWTKQALPSLPGEDNADLAPNGGWFAIDLELRLLRRP